MAVGGIVLYRYLARQSDDRTRWRSAFALGLTIGLVRAVLAVTGWYTVEHTGGPLQIPGYLLAMLAVPEAALLPRYRAATPAWFLVALGVLLTLTSLAAVCGLAAVATAVRGRR